MILELASPPERVQAVSRDDLDPCQNLLIEGPHKGAQLTCALPGQRVKHGFEVLTEAGAVALTLRNAATRTQEWIYKLPDGSMGVGMPVPERFLCGLGPEAGPLQAAQVGYATPRKAIYERVPSLPQEADRELAPEG
ncbi:hypothetical protein GCM10010275_20500 [Streptomyces litmocidini]|nr:hypothetical protein GCM10010275_20500 [Streptomyces litmocidini]